MPLAQEDTEHLLRGNNGGSSTHTRPYRKLAGELGRVPNRRDSVTGRLRSILDDPDGLLHRSKQRLYLIPHTGDRLDQDKD
jgi:hypothetical protein